jgi:hypothetical protein
MECDLLSKTTTFNGKRPFIEVDLMCDIFPEIRAHNCFAAAVETCARKCARVALDAWEGAAAAI